MDEEFKANFKKLMEDSGETRKLCTAMNEKISKITDEVNELKMDNEANKSDIDFLLRENYELKVKINNMDQYSRKSNLIICGIPYKEEEVLREVAKKLATKLEINLEDYEIAAIHRLPAKNKDTVPPIIIKLNNLDVKNKLIIQAKKLKPKCSDIGFKDSNPVYIDDHLTRSTLGIWMMAKKMREEGTLFYAQCREGKVKIRINENSHPIVIHAVEQLQQIHQEYGAKELEGGRAEKQNNKRSTTDRSPEVTTSPPARNKKFQEYPPQTSQGRGGRFIQTRMYNYSAKNNKSKVK